VESRNARTLHIDIAVIIHYNTHSINKQGVFMKIDNVDQFLKLLNLDDWTIDNFNDQELARGFFNQLQERSKARAELTAISAEVKKLTSALADKHYRKCSDPYGATTRGWGTEYVTASASSQLKFAEDLISKIIYDNELVDLINKVRAQVQAKKRKDEVCGE